MSLRPRQTLMIMPVYAYYLRRYAYATMLFFIIDFARRC